MKPSSANSLNLLWGRLVTCGRLAIGHAPFSAQAAERGTMENGNFSAPAARRVSVRALKFLERRVPPHWSRSRVN